jgi:hypothetical protein
MHQPVDLGLGVVFIFVTASCKFDDFQGTSNNEKFGRQQLRYAFWACT